MSILKSLARLVYKVGFVFLLVYWFLLSPKTKSVLCLIGFGEGDEREFLLVLHTYDHRGWLLPGGSVKRGESSEDAILREIREELSIEVKGLRKLTSRVHTDEYHEGHTDYYYAEALSKDFQIDGIEIKEARWVSKEEISKDPFRKELVSMI